MRQLLSSGHSSFFSTVPSSLRCGVIVAKNVVAMVANDAARVWHEAVAYLVMFDVTMGSFHGAEVCELPGIHILNDLANTYGQTTSDSTWTMDRRFQEHHRSLSRKVLTPHTAKILKPTSLRPSSS